MFPNKNRTLGGVKTVLSKIDATSSVERCSGSGWPRTARSPNTISDMDAEQSDLNPSTTRCTWSYESVDHGSRTWKSCVEEEWDRLEQEVIDSAISEWRKPLTDRVVNHFLSCAACVAACGRHRTFWTFTLNITAFVHILINMFWTLLTLPSFV